MFDLQGRVAMVTGGGQSVGAGIAQTLASSGAAVAVNDLFEERAETIAEEIRAAGGKACAAPFDVTDRDAVEAGVTKAQAELGPLDIVVNNAGVPPGMTVQQFRDTDPSEWAKFIDLNLYGVLHTTKAVIDGMCERGFGRIIVISSGAGQTGLNLGISTYGAGKGAATSFMRHFAMEVAPMGVTANTISLGMIDNHLDPSVTAHMSKSVPVGRLGQPQDIAPAVLFFASDQAGWITGQILGVNGGNLML
ncbi:MAG: short-chain dehydrogenase [Deltaproteobacteria bacterium]|jgi:3-oxoacyl-[acyl-carrier protein] reductase|nr:short-chain dehydrogenase [Deltaproteobacteria bacterium]